MSLINHSRSNEKKCIIENFVNCKHDISAQKKLTVKINLTQCLNL